MFLTHKKIVARSRSWVSRYFVKVEDKSPENIPDLRSTSVFNVFAKTGGVVEKFCFYFSI